MNHSNTEDHQPVSARDHLVHTVEMTVDNLSDETLDILTGGLATEVRLLVVGSSSWPATWQFAIAQAMIDWWVMVGRPETKLIVDGRGPFAVMALDSWNTGRFKHETHGVPSGASRNPERRIRRAMTEPPPAHVIVFRHGNDGYITSWLEYLSELRRQLVDQGIEPFTTTIIQIDEVR